MTHKCEIKKKKKAANATDYNATEALSKYVTITTLTMVLKSNFLKRFH